VAVNAHAKTAPPGAGYYLGTGWLVLSAYFHTCPGFLCWRYL